MVKYSIVAPAFNEEESVPIFCEAVIKTMEPLNEPFEIVLVNDGSRDKTVEVVKNLASKDSRIKLVSFARNFGQMNAIFAGLDHTQGEAVIVMDVDLQDPVEVLPLMIEKWKEGYDVVHGKRKVRKGENFLKKFLSKMFMKFLRKISKLDIPENVGEFKLLDRKVVDTFKQMPEHGRYLRGTTAWVGFKQTFVEFERKERVIGETKYPLSKQIKLAGTSIVSLSTWPLNLAMIFAGIIGLLAGTCLNVFIILACCHIYLPVAAWLFPTIGILFSIQLMITGFQNIYLKRTYEECQNRPRYIVNETVNIEK